MAVSEFRLRVGATADTIELLAFARGRMTFAGAVQLSIRQYPVDDRDRVASAEFKELVENEMEPVWAELERRARIMPDGYPFDLTDEAVLLRNDWKKRSSYLLCVLLTERSAEASNEERYDFEEVTGVAVAKIFGCDEWVRFGANRRPPVPSGFRAGLDYVLNRLGEGDAHKPRYPFPLNGDLSCDIVAWRRLPDECKPQVIVVAGCATSDDWKALNKHLEDGRTALRDASLGTWLSPMILAFSTPFRAFSDLDLLEVAQAGAFLINRWRIAQYAPEAPVNSVEWIEKQKPWAGACLLSWRSSRSKE